MKQNNDLFSKIWAWIGHCFNELEDIHQLLRYICQCSSRQSPPSIRDEAAHLEIESKVRIINFFITKTIIYHREAMGLARSYCLQSFCFQLDYKCRREIEVVMPLRSGQILTASLGPLAHKKSTCPYITFSKANILFS